MPRMNWLLAGLVVVAATWARAEEWPKWRGPRGDGISHETGLLDKWPDAGPPKVWTATVGLGFSSPIGFDGKIFLVSEDQGKDLLSAFDADSGKMIWTQPTPGGYPKNDYPGSRATPTIDGDRIFTYSGGGELVCRQVSDGKPVWNINILRSLGTSMLNWGEASSPLVTDKAVYVQCGEGGPLAVAVDKVTGQIAWKSQFTGTAGYAAPVMMDVGAARELIVFAASGLVGMEPMTGKTLWSVPWQTSYDVNASTPIVDGDKVFVTSGYGHGAAQFQVTAAGAQQVWTTTEVQSRFPAAVLDSGYLYCISEDRLGTLKCLDWKDGKVKWTARGGRSMKFGFGGSLVRFSDKLITMSQNGMLSLMKATPDGVSLISQVQLFDSTFDRVWSTPLIYHGKLYVKGEAELVCLNISGGTGQ